MWFETRRVVAPGQPGTAPHGLAGMTISRLLVCLLLPSCTSDLAAIPVISRAVVRIDLATVDAPPTFEVALTLVGGDEEHTATLESIAIGPGLSPVRTLDLRLPTPTVRMEPRTMTQVLLEGDLSRGDFIDHCQATLPVSATLTFADTPDLAAISPEGQLVVFCE